jgi:hypothetical protein
MEVRQCVAIGFEQKLDHGQSIKGKETECEIAVCSYRKNKEKS